MNTNSLVCVVDDEPSVRKSLTRLLASAGYNAQAFASAREYLARPPHHGPSCLVVDVRMPELSGLDLQRALLDSGRDEPVVFITGDDGIPASVQAMKAGAVDFLAKPLDDAVFLAAVGSAVIQSRERSRIRAEREDAIARLASLSVRERQVFERVIAGKMNKEIAGELGTSMPTVKVQRSQVMRKAGVESVADLVRLARLAGF